MDFKRKILSLFIGCAFVRCCAATPHQPASIPTKKFIRELLKKAGLNDTVAIIAQFTEQELREIQNPTIEISKTGDTYSITLHETWFNSLTERARAFVIMHEAMHIKLGHLEHDLNPESCNDMKKSREHELQADQEAVKLLQTNEGALDYFAREQKTEPKMELALNTHPTWQQRITGIKRD